MVFSDPYWNPEEYDKMHRSEFTLVMRIGETARRDTTRGGQYSKKSITVANRIPVVINGHEGEMLVSADEMESTSLGMSLNLTGRIYFKDGGPDIHEALTDFIGFEELPAPLPIHRTEASYPNCSTCDGGGCLDCTDPA